MTCKKTISLVTLSAVLALTACGGPAESEGDASKAMLTIGVPSIPTVLDPEQNFTRQQYSILALTAGTLTRLDREGKQVTMGLADSVTAGDKNYVVKLKSGLKFSDGSPLTAKDIVASFESYIANTSSAYASTYASIGKVTAVDGLTVNFELKTPDAALPFYLAQPQLAIFPAKVIEARGLKDLFKGDPPPTAGQFVAESFESEQVTLQANSHYAGPQPSTKTIVFKKITDPAARLAQLQGGGLDFADGIPPKTAGQIAAPVEVRKAIGVSGLVFLSLNNRTNSLLSDVRLRQAIAVAVDRDQINKVAWSGENKPTRSLFANNSQYNHPFLPEQPDIGRAKELLRGTKCAEGCTLRLIVRGDEEPRVDTGIVVQQNLKAIGIEVVINQAQSAAVQQQSSEGNFDILVGNAYDVADYPIGILNVMLGPPLNAFYTGYSSPEMGGFLGQISVTTGSEQRQWINRAIAQFEKDQPIVPIADSFIMSGSRVPSGKFDIDPTFFYHVG